MLFSALPLSLGGIWQKLSFCFGVEAIFQQYSSCVTVASHLVFLDILTSTKAELKRLKVTGHFTTCNEIETIFSVPSPPTKLPGDQTTGL